MQFFAENLACTRGTRLIFARISFMIRTGEGLVIKGPNGSGKTTLLRMLAGFIPIESGKVSLQGGDPEMDIGEQCHYIGHLNGVKSSLTVAENLEFYATYLGGEKVDEALENFGLQTLKDIPAGILSAGQKRRLGLARLLVAPRPIWLLDEPSVSLDKASADILAGLVKQHVSQDGIVIAATHVPLGIDFVHELDMGALDMGATQ